jgi:hypothetical protein
MMIFTDPAGASISPGFLPEEIECRACGRVYGPTADKGVNNVR